MKSRYKQLWKLAKPFYLKGRPCDIVHVSWMMRQANLLCKKEKIDESILIPLVILHDIGYAITEQTYYEKEKKKAHMIEGAKLAKQLLKQINYDFDKINQICSYIKIHDNWIFGETEIYENDKLLGIFHDLDFLWVTSENGFSFMIGALKKTRNQFIKELKQEASQKKFATQSTKEIFNKNIQLIVRRNLLK